MTVRKQIATYRLFTNRNNGGSVYIVAVERDENLPSELHIISAPVDFTYLRFEKGNGAILAVNAPDAGTDETRVVLTEGKTPRTISLHPIDELFSGSAIGRKLQQRNAGVKTIDDLLGICQKSVLRLLGSTYPEASLEIEDGDIRVDSPTAIPARTKTTNTTSPNMAGGRQRHRNLHVWI